jgi:hypothetical protein
MKPGGLQAIKSPVLFWPGFFVVCLMPVRVGYFVPTVDLQNVRSVTEWLRFYVNGT